MPTRFGVGLATPLLCAALLTGCGGDDGANDERRAQTPMTTAPAQVQGSSEHGAQAQATVALSGCVEMAPGGSQYVLRNVRFDSGQGQGMDPQRQTTTGGPQGITEGSWVRLDGGEREADLRKYAGQRVTLTGMVADSGQNTIGTAGSAGQPDESGARSQAGAPGSYSDRVKEEAGRMGTESMADGTAALVLVTAVESTGETCQTQQQRSPGPGNQQ